MARKKAVQQAITEALEAIRKRDKDGLLKPEAVVRAARNKESPLHRLFEWDDKKAAHAWRLEQARELIRSVRVDVEVEEKTITTVAYLHDPELPAGVQGYVNIMSLKSDEERAHAACVDEFMRAAAAMRRAHEISFVLEMKDEIQAVVKQIDTMRTRIEASLRQQPKSN